MKNNKYNIPTQEQADFLIELLADSDEPLSESLFTRLANALSEAFNISLAKSKAIVQSTLKSLFNDNAGIYA